MLAGVVVMAWRLTLDGAAPDAPAASIDALPLVIVQLMASHTEQEEASAETVTRLPSKSTGLSS